MLEIKAALVTLLAYCQAEVAEREKMLSDGVSGMPDYTRYAMVGKFEAYGDIARRLQSILDNEPK